MSLLRENITWQSKDKTWSLGFFTVLPGNAWEEDYDPEYDVDYDYSSFEWVSIGHPTEDAAFAAWRGVNPGGGSVLSYAGHSKEAKAYDLMAAWCKDPKLKEEHDKRELRRKNREHFKKLTEEFEAASRFVGARVQVAVKGDQAPHTNLGLQTMHTGRLQQEGAWLMLDKLRVFNTSTGKFEPKIHSIKPVRY